MSGWDTVRKRLLAELDELEKKDAGKKADDAPADKEEVVDEMDEEGEDKEGKGKKSDTTPAPAEASAPPALAEPKEAETDDPKEAAPKKGDDDGDDDKDDSDDDDDKGEEKEAGSDKQGGDDSDDDEEEKEAGSDCDDDEKDADAKKADAVDIRAEDVNCVHFTATNSWIFFHKDMPIASVTCEAAFGNTDPKSTAFFASDKFVEGLKRNFQASGVVPTLKSIKATMFNFDNQFTASPEVDHDAMRAEILADFANISGMVTAAMQKNLIDNPLKAGMFEVFARSGLAANEQQLVSLVEDVTVAAAASYTETLINESIRYMRMTEGERRAAHDLIARAPSRSIASIPGRNAAAQELAQNSLNVATAEENSTAMDKQKIRDLFR